MTVPPSSSPPSSSSSSSSSSSFLGNHDQVSVPSSRQVVKLSFTHVDAVDNADNHSSSSSSSVSPVSKISKSYYEDRTNTSTLSLSLNSENSESDRVRPPLIKQRDDISLLMRDLDDLTNNNNYSLCRSGDVSNGLMVFLIESGWWNGWLHGTDTTHTTHSADDTHTQNRINNWILVDEEENTKNNSEEKNIPQHNTDDERYHTGRFHLKKGVEHSDFKIVTYEVWTTLCAWYGGSPPLPAVMLIMGPNMTGSMNGSMTGSISGAKMTGDSKMGDDVDNEEEEKNESKEYSLDKELSLRKEHSLDSLRPVCPLSVEDVTPFILSPYSPFDSHTPTPSLIPSPSRDDMVSVLGRDIEGMSLSAAINQSTAVKTDCGGYSESVAVSGAHMRICFVCGENSCMRCAKCLAVYYCSQGCQRGHWKAHRKWCGAALQHRALPQQAFRQTVSVGRRGRVGLCNLGNSCYMSSSLQCLSHVYPLTAYFLSERYLAHINEQSKDSTGGKLAREYSSLLSDLWFENKAAVSPVAFKRLMGALNGDYAGLQQQDAHEVVEHLLDQLHEDVNLVTHKQYTEKPEGNGLDDEATAAAAWGAEKLREDSEVSRIFGGQLRSKIVCPDCGKSTVYFEYHRSHQLAIPRSTLRPVQVVHIHLRDKGGPVMLVPKVDRLEQIGALKREVSDLVSKTNKRLTRPANLCLVELTPSGHSISRILEDNDRVGSLRDGVILAAYELDDSDAIDANIVLLQRRITTAPPGPSNPSPSPRPMIELVGLPLLLAYSSKWSCARVKVFLWKQVARLINIGDKGESGGRGEMGGKGTESPLRALIRAATEDGDKDVKSQMLLASLLPIRFCDQNGRPVTAKGNPGKGAASISLHGLCADGGLDGRLEFGSTVPYDSSISLAEFFGQHPSSENVIIVTMDWSGVDGWLALLDEKKMRALGDNPAPNTPSLSLSAPSSSSFTLNQCLAEYTREEILDEANARYCANCKQHKRAKKVVKFWGDRLPEVLILSLKRFEFRGLNMGGSRSASATHRAKIDAFVDFPIDGLDLAPYCSGKEGEEDTLYDLFAVTNHYGRLGFGHYTSFARNWAGMYGAKGREDTDNRHTDDSNIGWGGEEKKGGRGEGKGEGKGDGRGEGKSGGIGEGKGEEKEKEKERGEEDVWHSYDDNDVSRIQTKDVQTRAAYILFYRKRPLSSTPSSPSSS